MKIKKLARPQRIGQFTTGPVAYCYPFNRRMHTYSRGQQFGSKYILDLLTHPDPSDRLWVPRTRDKAKKHSVIMLLICDTVCLQASGLHKLSVHYLLQLLANFNISLMVLIILSGFYCPFLSFPFLFFCFWFQCMSMPLESLLKCLVY